MKLDDIKKIMEVLEKSDLRKMIIKQDDFELHLEKESTNSVAAGLAEKQVAVSTVSVPVAKSNEVVEIAKDSSYPIESPMVGTFYSTPAPDQPAFVKIGDRINKDTVVCIIEAMKVMNEVKAGISGTVVEVLVENGQPVEFGTPLFRIV